MWKSKILTACMILCLNLILHAQGNVGIGIDNPERKLHVFRGSAGPFASSSNTTAVFESNTDNYLSLFSPAISETGILFGNPSSAASGGIVYNSGLNGNGLQFRTNGNTPRMFLDSLGNLGLNVPQPLHRLDVSGSSFFRNGNFGINQFYSDVDFTIRGEGNSSIFRIEDNVGSEIFRIDQNGHVGYRQTSNGISFNIRGKAGKDILNIEESVGVDILNIDNEGRVGVRAKDINAVMNIKGKSGLNVLNIENSAGEDILKIDNNERTGIRGIDPNSTFTVRGKSGLDIIRLRNLVNVSVFSINENSRFKFRATSDDATFNFRGLSGIDIMDVKSNLGVNAFKINAIGQVGFGALNSATVLNLRAIPTIGEILNVESAGGTSIFKIDRQGRMGYRQIVDNVSFNVRGKNGLAKVFQVEDSSGNELLHVDSGGALYLESGDIKMKDGKAKVIGSASKAELELLPDNAGNSRNSSILFGEGSSGTFGMRWEYNGLFDNLRLYGVNNSNSSIGPHLVVRRESGHIAIGANNFATNYELSVNGDIICETIFSSPIGLWPDYVFSSSYDLRPLDDVEEFIDEHHHLPGIPSAAEIDSTGVDLGEMNRLLLEKVEELTLYVIQQNEKTDQLIDETAKLKQENNLLNARLKVLEN